MIVKFQIARVLLFNNKSKIPEFLTLLLSQLKRGYASLAVIERFNSTFCFSIQSLNFQIDPPVSGQPELKKSISQGNHRLIDYGITILVNSYYIKFLSIIPVKGKNLYLGDL